MVVTKKIAPNQTAIIPEPFKAVMSGHLQRGGVKHHGNTLTGANHAQYRIINERPRIPPCAGILGHSITATNRGGHELAVRGMVALAQNEAIGP